MYKAPHGRYGCQVFFQLRPSGASISGALPGFNLLFTWSSQQMKGMEGWQIPLPSQSTTRAQPPQCVFFFFFSADNINRITYKFSSVQFSHSVMSDSATPRTAACQAFLSVTNSQSLPKLILSSLWFHPHLILSFPSPPAFNLLQHQGFFPMSQFFASGGQSIGASASASVLQWIFRVDFL